MNQEPLVAALENAVRQPEILNTGEASTIDAVRKGAITPEPSNEKLKVLVQAQRDLAIFDRRLQFLHGGHAQEVTYDALVDWLIFRANEVGAARATEELATYVTQTELPFLEIAALRGISLDSPFDLANGIRLVPFAEVPSSQAKDLVISGRTIFQADIPTAALLRIRQIPKRHWHPDSSKPPVEGSVELGFRELYEAGMLLTLVGPSSPAVRAAWAVPQTSIPCCHKMGVLLHRPFGVEAPFVKSIHLDAAMLAAARALSERYSTHQGPARETLRISIERLNWAMQRPFLADKAIDLGIALEALFLSDGAPDRGELGFQLRIRCARFMGKSLEERSDIANLIRRLYRIRSGAVHSGTAPTKIEGIPSEKVLQDGFILMTNALTKFILDGMPSWTDLVLG